MDKKFSVLVVGGGGREHAFAWKLAQSPHVSKVICVPGNGGTAGEEKCLNVDISATDIPALVKWARQEHPDLTVVGPEVPLVAGIVDQWPYDLQIWGPHASAALLEGSKIFAKKEMDYYGIPTAPWIHFDNPDRAKVWLNSQSDRGLVVKADGLTGGKGALVCNDKEEARLAIDQMDSFGEAGKRFIIEERLAGPEASLFLLCGARGRIIPLENARDFKRVGDGDTGLNTGGMGAYSPASHLTSEMISDIITKLQPMINKLSFIGFLYVGLMLIDKGWKVLEFNVRMGDPETQVILPRLKTDLALILNTMAGYDQYPINLEWTYQSAVTVVMTSGGYPGDYKKGDVITGLDRVQEVAPGTIVFHAGTKLVDGQILTAGGRVLAITGLDENVTAARALAYRATSAIDWTNVTFRHDIAEGI